MNQPHFHSASVSKPLADFIVRIQFDDLDTETIRMATQCLKDAIGVSIAASTLGEGCQAFANIVDVTTNLECTLLGFSKKTSSVEAAWVNGALAHALDFEDAHDKTLTHPNAAIVAALLSAAEKKLPNNDRCLFSGKQFITAMVLGCEIVCRLARGLDQPLDDFGWYPPPILGAFGAAAAVAKLYKLNEIQIINAFSIVLCNVSCSAEIKYNPESSVRAIRDAFSAQIGLQAVLLAMQGVTGFEFPFEGKAGFYQNFARGKYSAERVVEGLVVGDKAGKKLINFEIKHISFKAWPSCRGTHAFIEAAIALMKSHKIKVDDIQSVEAKGCRINKMLAEPIESKQSPKSAIDAKFSIPFTVAVAIVYGDVTLDNFLPDSLKDERVLSVSSKISFEVDHDLDDSPKNMTTGYLSIATVNGKHVSVTISEPYGAVSRPLSKQSIDKKFRSCCQYAASTITKKNTDKLIEIIDSLDGERNLSDNFFPLLG
ncbi:MAG: MmgE/PrpD family protein [Cellvibrionaceae bacterium]